MQTYTYYVVCFYRSYDPRPKYLAGETEEELRSVLKNLKIQEVIKDRSVITVKDEVKKSWLSNTDYCTVSNNSDGVKCFCGKPIIQEKIFV